jgi:hypothetical protein
MHFRKPLFYTAFAGTQSSMATVELLQSVFLKPDEFVKPEYPETRFLSSNKDVIDFFSIHLNTAVFNLENAPLVLDKLRSRKRICAQVIAAIIDYVSSHPQDRDYKAILATQTDKIYEQVVSITTDRLVGDCYRDNNNILFFTNCIKNDRNTEAYYYIIC